jgi:hypothetical protein
MTRKVTVTFDDSTQKVYTGIPDASTPAMIEAKVKQEYPNKKIKNIHGEKEAATSAVVPVTPVVTPAPTNGDQPTVDGRKGDPRVDKDAQQGFQDLGGGWLKDRATGKIYPKLLESR